MPVITLEIKGLRELMKNFKKSPLIVYRELNKAIKKIGFMVTMKAKDVTPVKTGALRASIRPSFRRLTAIIEPHINYALYVHEGTRYMKPRPFLKWGLENSVTDIENELTISVQRALNKLGKI